MAEKVSHPFVCAYVSKFGAFLFSFNCYVPTGQDPRSIGVYRGNSMGAGGGGGGSSRGASLADMRRRLHSRFGPQQEQLRQQRPGSAMDIRFPADPLFGESNNDSNHIAFPDVQAFSRNMRERHSLSVPNSPRQEWNDFSFDAGGGGSVELDPLLLPGPSRYNQYGGGEGEEEALHHSMPNISTSNDWGDMFAATKSNDHWGHNSAPDMMLSDGFGDDSMSDLEPIPLTEITPRPASKKSISGKDFKKPISVTLSPTSPAVGAVSDDLMARLEQLTGSSIRESNPFDPLPLGEEGEEEPLECDRAASNNNFMDEGLGQRGMLFDE